MGHIQYFMQYKDQPHIFQRSANPGEWNEKIRENTLKFKLDWIKF